MHIALRHRALTTVLHLALLLGVSCDQGKPQPNSSPSSSISGLPMPAQSSTRTPSTLASPIFEDLLYLGYSGGAGASQPTYSFVTANLDGSHKVRRSLGDYPRPDEVTFTQSRNGRFLAWSDHLELRTAPSADLDSAVTITRTRASLRPLAISEDGSFIAYQILSYDSEGTSSAKLFIANVQTKSSRLIRTFSGPFINCLGEAAFDDTASRIAVIGCGSGSQAGLVVINASNGKVLSEDDEFFSFAGMVKFSHDLRTAWLIDPAHDASDLVRYDVASGKRVVLYHSPGWRQSDSSVAPNLGGLLLSPDQTTLAFRRFSQDKVSEVRVIPSSGGGAKIIAKDATFGRIESWSPDGRYVTVSLKRTPSTPTHSMLLINPRTMERVIFDDAGATSNGFLAWIAS